MFRDGLFCYRFRRLKIAVISHLMLAVKSRTESHDIILTNKKCVIINPAVADSSPDHTTFLQAPKKANWTTNKTDSGKREYQRN